MTECAELFRYENKKYTILYSLIILRSGPIDLVTYYSNIMSSSFCEREVPSFLTIGSNLKLVTETSDHLHKSVLERQFSNPFFPAPMLVLKEYH